MALLFMDSFDHYATADILLKPYAAIQTGVSGGTPTQIAAVGRNSTNGLQLRRLPNGLGSASGAVVKHLSTISSTTSGGVGFAFSQNGLNEDYTNGAELLRVLEGSTAHLTVVVNATTGTLTVRRNTTTLDTSSIGITAGVYYYLEFKWTIHDSAGAYELRLNGASILSGSSIDTRNGGTGVWDTIQLSAAGTTGAGYGVDIDDFVIWDTSGSANNDFLGPIRVKAVFADGAGTHTDFTPSTGSNYQNVDEASQDGDTTYNTSTSPGDIDTYTYGALGITGAVLGVQTNLFVRSAGAGAETFRPKMVISATDYSGTTTTLSTTYANSPEVFETSPATASAWTVSEIDGAEFGIELVS